MRAARGRRNLIIAFIVLIVAACIISAVLSLLADHVARAASTFFAGVAFAFLLGSRLPPRTGGA